MIILTMSTVFQYEFKPPGREEDKTYTMLWDYNVGLVRTTPLFKCCGYGKVCYLPSLPQPSVLCAIVTRYMTDV